MGIFMSQNVDPQELAKFTVHASQWWDDQGELKTLHAINPLRLGYIKEKTALKDKKVIDVGCGGGILSESMSKEGAIVTGIDLNKSLLNAAKLHQYESGTTVTYIAISAEAMATTHAGQFDVVTCLELLEHVPDPFSVIQACATLVKPEGHLFFSTLNRNLKSYLFAILGAEYILKLLPRNTHDYAKFIRPSELSHWVRQAHLQPQDIIGIAYNPLTKHYKLTTDTSVNYIFHARK